MKNKSILVFIMILMLGTTSAIFGFTEEENEIFKDSLKDKVAYEIETNGYGRLIIDKTFDMDKVKFEGSHKVYSFNNKEKNSVLEFSNKFVTRVDYNGKEIANIYYTLKNNEIKGMDIVFNYADTANDVILDNVYAKFSYLKNLDYICIIHDYQKPPSLTAAFLVNEEDIKIIADEKGMFNEYMYNNKYSRNLTKEEFNKTVEDTTSLASTQQMLKVIFVISIIGLILNLFVLFVYKVDKKEVSKKVVHKKVVKK
ncbi:MAG: hypothetical protein RR922_03915 [Clostridia bacterium]